MHRIFAIFTVVFALLHCVPTVADDVLDDSQIEIEADTETESEQIEIDQEIEAVLEIDSQMLAMGWCPNDEEDDPGYPDARIADLCNKLKEAGNLQAELNANMDELEDNAKAMRENEQSLANRALTAASTAATGLGLMTAASAYSEKRADEAAEQDMSAYLATFRCEYGKGQSTKAGNEEITLPGGNELLEYYSEYKNLADGLKETKKALGIRPGIEQEVVYDKAESGLYKYASTGITDGAFTSLSRALTDTEGKDAAEWNEQKDSSAKKLKGGAIAAGVGIVGGIVGNYLINKKGPKNRAQELVAKRREIQSSYDTLVAELVDKCNKTIQAHKDSLANLPQSVVSTSWFQQYKQDVQAAVPVTNLDEITKSKFCL